MPPRRFGEGELIVGDGGLGSILACSVPGKPRVVTPVVSVSEGGGGGGSGALSGPAGFGTSGGPCHSQGQYHVESSPDSGKVQMRSGEAQGIAVTGGAVRRRQRLRCEVPGVPAGWSRGVGGG